MKIKNIIIIIELLLLLIFILIIIIYNNIKFYIMIFPIIILGFIFSISWLFGLFNFK